MSATKVKKYDVVGQMMAFESSQLMMDEVIDLFIHLLNTGIINHLQGHYGCTAESFLRTGAIIWRDDNVFERGEL